MRSYKRPEKIILLSRNDKILFVPLNLVFYGVAYLNPRGRNKNPSEKYGNYISFTLHPRKILGVP